MGRKISKKGSTLYIVHFLSQHQRACTVASDDLIHLCNPTYALLELPKWTRLAIAFKVQRLGHGPNHPLNSHPASSAASPIIGNSRQKFFPSREPSGRGTAFTPLQLTMLQDLCTLKRRERRAPVQGFNARNLSGDFHPVHLRSSIFHHLPLRPSLAHC